MEPNTQKNLKKFRSKQDFGTRKKDPETLKIHKLVGAIHIKFLFTFSGKYDYADYR
jgi:hypothetical protein